MLYLSIFELPKKFAFKNKDKTFLYNINEEKFVDFNNKEYKNFPILPGAIIQNLDESFFLLEIKKKLQEINGNIIKLKFIKNIYFPINNKNDIYNNLKENQIYIIVKNNIFNSYFKFNNEKGYYENIKLNLIKYSQLQYIKMIKFFYLKNIIFLIKYIEINIMKKQLKLILITKFNYFKS